MNKPGKGEYHLFRKPNVSDVKLRRSKSSGWRVPIKMRSRALLLTEGTLFAAGNPDPLAPKGNRDAQPGPIATGLLQGFSTEDGAMTFTHKLSSPPVFDSLAAARGALYLCTVDGTLLCLSGARTKSVFHQIQSTHDFGVDIQRPFVVPSVGTVGD